MVFTSPIFKRRERKDVLTIYPISGHFVVLGAYSCAFFLVAIMLLQSLLKGDTVQQLSYSDFKSALRQDHLQEVQISKTHIRGRRLVSPASGRTSSVNETTPPQPVRFYTVRVEDSGLIQEFEVHQVPYCGQVDNGDLKTLISWLIPLGIFFFLFSRFADRMGPGQGLMNFGKSRARIYAEKETGVTFAEETVWTKPKRSCKKSSISCVIPSRLCHEPTVLTRQWWLSIGEASERSHDEAVEVDLDSATRVSSSRD